MSRKFAPVEVLETNEVDSNFWLPDIGIKIRTVTGGLYQKLFEKYGVWEVTTTQKIMEFVKPGMIVVDVGANIGYYTCMMSKLVGPTGYVYAFEPVVVAPLYENLAQNHCENVFVFPKALGITESLDVISGMHRQRMRCNSFSLDDVKMEPIHFIKIDVDGGDVEVLQGARKTLDHLGIEMSFECSRRELKPFGHTVEELYDEVISQGFSIYQGKRELQRDSIPSFANLWGVK